MLSATGAVGIGFVVGRRRKAKCAALPVGARPVLLGAADVLSQRFYFPVKRVVRENEPAEDLDWRMEDVAAVRKVFTLLDAEVKQAQGRIQVIVLDHADEEVGADCPMFIQLKNGEERQRPSYLQRGYAPVLLRPGL
ncbi:hypothetical protein J2W35_004600 [Variovorax boronicumulans]|uniref:DUF3732 domain-containing protein n=1 Tax=Variovorax boronicumulans TaxID=436515 RepID=UPI00278B642F|nr:DUF3732 domain-containing protein [Variovorax boronicumulans]MDQ0084232.1 hypothetical protein [Variovorax boronicumulans]